MTLGSTSEILRQGARKMLQQAIENEVSEYIDRHPNLLDEGGQRLVVRNGLIPERELLTEIGKVPKRMQAKAKQRIHDMYLAKTKEQALQAYDEFLHLYEAKYPKACACLRDDKDVLFTFYDFPAEHWIHIRITNPIESTFATLLHRTNRIKGCGSRTATLIMVY